MICERCGEPIAFGESHATIYDSAGRAAHVHVLRLDGRLEEHCPRPPDHEFVAYVGDADEQEVG